MDLLHGSRSYADVAVRSRASPRHTGRVRYGCSDRVARGEATPDSLDLLVDIDERGLLEQASLGGDLEDLLRCTVQVTTTRGLHNAREHIRERIEREAISL